MLKKLASLFLAVVVCVVTATSVSAETYAINKDNVSEISPISPIARSSFDYGNFDIDNGMTMLLGNGNSNTNGCFYIAAGSTIILSTELTSNESYLDMGYYNYAKDTYTKCSKKVSYMGASTFVYTCSMTISTSGYYKFFISNNTANILTFKNTYVSY
ncbi:MAG: hypothetical protein K2H90_05035 [Oscillospiraceae bacterium]|nr:hypothetical protein [Oscillospiraceae bacterium]